jgi:hypothetical protein
VPLLHPLVFLRLIIRRMAATSPFIHGPARMAVVQEMHWDYSPAMEAEASRAMMKVGLEPSSRRNYIARCGALSSCGDMLRGLYIEREEQFVGSIVM